MKIKRFSKAMACVLSACMILSSFTVVASAASDYKSETHDVFKHTESTLAPGVEQSINYAYAKDGKQMVYYVATADISRDDVEVHSSYKDAQCTEFGMDKLTNQMAAANAKYTNSENANYNPYFVAVAGVNGDFYNMTTGQPSGAFVMDGIMSSNKANNRPFFAIMEDGTALCGANNSQWDAAVAAHGKVMEAVGGSQMLVVDGKDVTASASGSYNTDRHSRTMVGVTADGKVVMTVLDGRQEPFSCGGTMHELAQIMLEQGCVSAINLDGGGSTTFAARPEGETDVKVINRPSDGSERSISSGLLIASTATPSDTFDHAVLTADNNYVTPSSTVSISAVGVSPAGTSAEIPADVTYTATLGTISADGKFTSDGTTGAAKIQMLLDGNVVGETTVNVVIPDSLEFSQSQITVPYSKTVEIELVAKYGLNEVALKPADVKFTLENPEAATLNGFSLTACAGDIAGTGITAVLVHNEAISSNAQLLFGKGSEIVESFENYTIPSNASIKTGYPQYGPAGANGQNEKGSIEIVDSSSGKVHSGEKSLAVNCDFSQLYETGYHLLNYNFGTKTFKIPSNATAFGFWMYVPQDTEALYMRPLIDTDGNGSGDYTPDIIPTGLASTYTEEGWHYYNIDMSHYNSMDSDFYCIQIYVSDRDGASYNYYFKNQYSVDSKFTLYIDDITYDYSSVVDDREAPQFTSVRYADRAMSDAAELNNQTVNDSVISFGAIVHENTSKNNYTGLNAATAKAYIDGIEVESKYSGGTISVQDAQLADGVHTVSFEIADNAGNLTKIHRNITISANSGLTYVNLVPKTPNATNIPIGSIQWYDLKTNSVENIKSIKTVLNLNSVSNWELEGMTVADGFKADYSVDKVTNDATITITKTGEVKATGEAVIASIPVRTWISTITNDPGYEASTPQSLWSRKIIWPKDIKLTADYGMITFADNTTGKFASATYQTITELYGNFAALNANGDYSNKKSWHIHTAEPVEDKAATCTESGYTVRTFCAECNSVVDWGTIVPATGHTYEMIDDTLKCSSCGILCNGEYDNKTYFDGILANGWVNDSYYTDGVKAIGLEEIDGIYYDFGDDGICPNRAKLNGFYYDNEVSSYRYFTAGELVTGDIAIYPNVYFFDENGYAIHGNVSVLGYECKFGDKGEFVSSDNKNVVDAGYCGTNIQYVLLSDGTLKVDGDGALREYSANGIYPGWIIKNEPTAVTSLEIGSHITEIGKFAFFRNQYLRKINFEENSSLKTIGWGAFGHCWRLAEVTIPASVETLKEYAFYECGALKSFDVESGSNLKTISDSAFVHDIGLESVYIPDSVTTMGNDIFYKTKADVVLSVVKRSVAHAYAEKYNLKFNLRDGYVEPLYQGDLTNSVIWKLYADGTLSIEGSGAMPDYTSHTQQPWSEYRDKITKIVIGKDITSIGNYAFCYSQNVISVDIEEGSKLTNVGVLAFFNLPKLQNFNLPDTVTSINSYAFGDCFALTNLYVSQKVNFIYHSSFSNSENVTLNVAEGTYAEQFAIDHKIKYVTRELALVPVAEGTCGDNVKWALFDNGKLVINGSGAMSNYTSHTQQPWAKYRDKITTIVIGKDITSIGNYAFCYSQNVDSVEFEEGSKLTNVGVLAFFNLPKITEVTLPDTVTSINSYAFGDCFALNNLHVSQKVNFIYHSAFSNSENVTLNVAEGTYAEQFAIDHKIKYVTRELALVPVAEGTCGDNVKWALFDNGKLVINGSGAMSNYTSHTQQPWAKYRDKITTIVIGKDITSIGNYTFCYSQNVDSVEFEEGSKLTNVGVLAFFNLPKITEVTLPDTVTSINSYAFGDCFALNNLYVPQKVNFIYHSAFSNSKNLTLNVVKGTYAEQFAIVNNINYIVR